MESKEGGSSHKTMKLTQHEQLEMAIYKWFVQRSVGLPTSFVKRQ